MAAATNTKTGSDVYKRQLIRALVRLLFRIGLRLEIEGREHLPASGPLVIIGNHFIEVDVVDEIFDETAAERMGLFLSLIHI